MSSIMLIDGRHGEETRVGVLTENKLDEFDYESTGKTQIKGNVYLAKVTRVEPSLQAAFVEYGGNRQGFLAFSEIHPDYYQIPVEDREALIAEEVALDNKESPVNDAPESEEEQGKKAKKGKGAEDDIIDEELLNKRRIRALKRRYKIQEVIKKRQVLLVQVVKEERGTKGAALTTYLSLPGRYCVLMPNTTHGNGISRKIGDAKERQRLRKILDTFTVPAGMGCIIRTAGMSRTKPEIKRDLDYLFKAWAEIRELTLKSSAPALIFEEGNLIKRSLRDLYDKHINEVLVEGPDAYKAAKDFMKRLIPTHAKKVKEYKGRVPLFHKYGAEGQIDNLFAPVITLPSGGYLVINPTEALIAIDVNSGKATKEHNIEETALQTNIEAAQEIARQLRLRDIAGLIVIDFIDMEEFGNVKTIERKFRDALKADRARIFTSRISALGLLEMSRQRLRASLYEISTQPCPHCEASGRIPSMSTLGLRVLRHIEDSAIDGRYPHFLVQAPQELALFLLNAKREAIDEIENRFDISVTVTPNARMRMPHFDIKGLTEDQMAQEMEKDATLSMLVYGDEQTTGEPEGFGKSDGRGSFPGKKRKRGKRGGTRGKPQRGRRPQQQDQRQGSTGEAKPDAKPEPKPDDKNKSEARGRPRRGHKPAAAKADKAAAEGKPEAKPDRKAAGGKDDKRAEKQAGRQKPKKAAKETTEKSAGAVKEEKPKAKKEPKPKKEPKAKKEEKAAEAPAAPAPEKKRTGPKRRGWWQRAGKS